jgi:nucleotide-binding universal stress UspA family protein
LYIKHIAVGDPAREILKLIDKENIDLVVMASQGAQGNFRFGSVTERVLKNSKVPVTTIPIETD